MVLRGKWHEPGGEPRHTLRDAESFLVRSETWEAYVRARGSEQLRLHLAIFYGADRPGLCVAPTDSRRHNMDVTPGYARVLHPVLIGKLPAHVVRHHALTPENGRGNVVRGVT